MLYATSLLCAVATGCSWQIRAPTVSHGGHVEEQSWRIHCETGEIQEEHDDVVPGADNGSWILGKDREGERILLGGELLDGFFQVNHAYSPAEGTLELSRTEFRRICIETIAARNDSDQIILGWVMAAREHEDIEVPIIYPGKSEGDYVSRVVIFGDSLTDSGRLKRRLRVFPNKPYWLGRFSNGPVWPEYLAMATNISVQNNSYGGASVVYLENLPDATLISRIRDYGQLFVSGTIELQISDYLERSLDSQRIQDPDETAFVIWAGANDYISKEPFTGLITTFLNTPQGESGYHTVVEQTVEGLAQHVETLYMAGARRFLLLNMPDLGRSPIVLQNTTYTPEYYENNDVARRLELSRRLTELTLYHNQSLALSVDQLRGDLPDASIVLVDTFSHFSSLYGDPPGPGRQPTFYGYDYAASEEILAYEEQEISLQRPCYKGAYLGTFDPDKICEAPEKALFWDIVHPTSLTHCWQAWSVGNAMHTAGWLGALPQPREYLHWCQSVVERITLGYDSWYIVDN